MGKIRTAIVTGTGVPLLMFLAWDAAILGSLKPGADAGADPLQTLIGTDPIVGSLVQIFSFLAVATSFIGFLFGLVDFVGDLLNVSSHARGSPFLPWKGLQQYTASHTRTSMLNTSMYLQS